nr:energy transducer TonB [Roseococcus sp. MDT2-1-1]
MSPTAGLNRAAGVLVPPGLDPNFRNREIPYPEAARFRNETGTVALELSVGTDGRVAGVRVTQSSGSRILDEAAQRGALAWRFRPATRDGLPIPSTARTSVQFRLQ